MTVQEALILLSLIGITAAWWFNALRARDIALRAARDACKRHDLQLLDETVAVMRLRPARHPSGQLGLRRWFHFEFTDDGGSRRKGSVEVFGRRASAPHLDMAPFTLHEFENASVPEENANNGEH